MNLKFDEIAPVCHPLVEKRSICRLHDLVAARQIRCDPACDVVQSLWSQSTAFAEPSIHCYSITTSKVLDDHVCHLGHMSSLVEAIPPSDLTRSASIRPPD